MIDWNEVEQVFLDMDGTLLDLHFDNHFWLEHVPGRYAEANSISLTEAKQELYPRYSAIEGTMEWYCVDHWSRELGLDIVMLKEEVDHLIRVHPHVVDFLHALNSSGRRAVLVTNAHQKALALKMQRTQLADHFDLVVSAHELGTPKEEQGFWAQLHHHVAYDKLRTLFVDDNAAVLRSAKAYGFRWLLGVTTPDSQGERRGCEGFRCIDDFSELLPIAG